MSMLTGPARYRLDGQLSWPDRAPDLKAKAEKAAMGRRAWAAASVILMVSGSIPGGISLQKTMIS